MTKMHSSWTSVACPLCDKRQGKVIVRHEFGELKKCDTCGIYYSNIRPSKEKFYEIGLKYLPTSAETQEAFDARNKEAIKDFMRIEKLIDKGELFDVGASSGIFMKVGEKRGWKVNGNDISPRCVAYGQQVYGLDIIPYFLEDINFNDSKFDLITMIQTIEHLLNPVKEMKILRNILKEDGHIYITTPTIADDEELLIKNHMLPFHTTNFTEKTLLKLLHMLDFEMIFSEKYKIDEIPYIRLLCKRGKEDER